MHKTIVLLIIFLMFGGAVFSQNKSDSINQNIPVIFFAKYSDKAKPIISKYSLPGNFYASNLGFFCRKELQVQKAVKLPVFFRLGTLEYCNRLEGKLPY